MAPPTVIGVDVGTGSARALAVANDGRIVARASAPFPGREAWPAGRADPKAWRSGVKVAIRRLGISTPAALAIGGQNPTTVPLAGGMAVTVRHPAGITGSPEEQHAAQRDVLLQEQAAAIGRQRGVAVAQLWDWLLHELGAQPSQSRWPGDSDLDGYGPRMTTGAQIGEANGSWGVPAGTPLVGGAPDAYLALWAAGTERQGRGAETGGRTGGLAVAVASGQHPAGMYGMAGAVPGIDLVGGPVAAHGLMLDWLSTVTGRDPAELVELAANVPAGSSGLIVLPYLEGERAPRWNRSLRAELVGVASDHGPAELARAVLEGTAYGLAHLAERLRAAGVAIEVVACTGSPARSRLWCEIKASVLGVPVEVPDEPEFAAYGAALAAGAGVNWWPAPGAGAPGSWPRPRMSIVEPNPHPAYRSGYERFITLGDAAVARLSQEAPCPTA